MYLFYHPLGKENVNVEANTYSSHGIGKLDFPGNNMPIYAMCDGVIYKTTYSSPSGCTACVLSCSCSNLNSTFYIRYLHGNFDNVKDGQTVKRGQLLGYSSDNGSAGSYHLHLDFSMTKRDFQPVYGKVKDKNDFTVDGETYSLKTSNIDWDKITKWKNQSGYNNNQIGYCWLVMASKPTYISNESAAGNSSIVEIGKQVIMAHYQNWVNNVGLNNKYYSQSAYLKTTINGIEINSRRDCSGYISGVMQALGDTKQNYSTADFTGNNYPSNWTQYKMSEIGEDKLQPGDVIVAHRSGFTHTELFVEYKNGAAYSYNLGSDSALKGSANGDPIVTNPSSYTHILRRN